MKAFYHEALKSSRINKFEIAIINLVVEEVNIEIVLDC
jgi:hypothetical protein